MDSRQWKQRVGNAEAYRRAGGRRGFNRRRHDAMHKRRRAVWDAYFLVPADDRPTHKQLAIRFGVGRSTVTRYLSTHRKLMLALRRRCFSEPKDSTSALQAFARAHDGGADQASGPDTVHE